MREVKRGYPFFTLLIFFSIIFCEKSFRTAEGILVLSCLTERTALDLNVSHAINRSNATALKFDKNNVFSAHIRAVTCVGNTKMEFSLSMFLSMTSSTIGKEQYTTIMEK